MSYTFEYDPKLVNDALWIVIDPWELQPESDDPTFTGTGQDSINDYFAELIHWRLTPMRHKVVSCDDVSKPLARYFECYSRLDWFDDVKQYCETNEIDSIVYTGFHHGKCVIHAECGAKKAQQADFKTYLAMDLVCAMKRKPDPSSTIANANFEREHNKVLKFFTNII